ncbi:MAG: rhomboid family intramembrane serine protease [Hyphomicrobiales bacterium]|nr:rhomboid family intramembrane serine protease [Hyphomicrobiales bacterium]
MVLIPLSDDAPTERREPPYVTYALIALNVAVYLFELSYTDAAEASVDLRWGATPDLVFGGGADFLRRFAPLVTYMFLHGGFAHVFGNMLFLWIFGDDVEDALGHVRYALFYLVCGIAGALVYCAFSEVRSAPLIGASGAIAGVMGAYLMLRPCAHVHVLVFVRVVPIRAMWVILVWTALQVWRVFSPDASNTAWWAHVGGLVTGAILMAAFRRPHVTLFECVEERKFVSPWTRPPVSRIPR